ncbi:hypothetical protein Tco_0199454 [Tanacetum coccineum]
MLGVLLLQKIGELRTELVMPMLDEEQLLFLAGRQTNTFDDDVDEGLVQDMAQNEDNIFQSYHDNEDQVVHSEMRMIINDRNVKEASLQKELHSVKMKLNYALNNNKLIREEVLTLTRDFKQKENKLLEEFLDMKHLKEKGSNRLQESFCLSKAKQVQPALYNGYEIVKTNNARP